MAEPVRETQSMISGMSPRLDETSYVFCVTAGPALATHVHPLATFHEDEGLSLILTLTDATELGFDTAMPMARITLTVHSALDGIGLTAAVASALATAGIPCNMVAGYHHDHVFVPTPLAGAAMAVLQDLQRKAQ